MTRSRPLRLLYAAQAVAAVGMAAGGTAGGLLAGEISGDPTTVAMPMGALVVGATVAVAPVSVAMDRHGRRTGLLLGLVVAMLGALVVLVGAHQRLLGPVLVGNALLGAGNTAVMFGRYVAADLAGGAGGPAATRRAAGAVSAALTAAAVGAVLGPNLLAPASRLAGAAGLPASAGLYAVAVPAFTVAALLVLRLPANRTDAAGTADGRTGRHGGDPGPRRPRLAAPLLLGSANATMVTIMAVAPPALHHHGWRLPAVGLVVSLHVAAMFGFSPVSGWLCTRFPVLRVIAGAAVLSALAALGSGLLADRAGATGAVAALLVVLGGAWNAQLIGGTMLLLAGLRTAHRHFGEAAGEVVMGVGAAVGTLSAAPLLAYTGAGGLGVCAALLNLCAAAAVTRSGVPADRHGAPADSEASRDRREGPADRLEDPADRCRVPVPDVTPGMEQPR